jgi:cell shape-determining protein MreD
VSLLVAGVAGLVFDVVLGRAAGVTVFVSALVLLVTLWILYPMLLRRDVRS